MKKAIIPFLLAITLLFPLVSAVWWNPFTWFIFQSEVPNLSYSQSNGHWEISITGNESKWVDKVEIIENKENITTLFGQSEEIKNYTIKVTSKSLSNRTYDECSEWTIEAIPTCTKTKKVTYDIPNSVKVKDKDGIEIGNTTKKPVDYFEYTFDTDKKYLKLGENSITLTYVYANDAGFPRTNITFNSTTARITNATINYSAWGLFAFPFVNINQSGTDNKVNLTCNGTTLQSTNINGSIYTSTITNSSNNTGYIVNDSSLVAYYHADGDANDYSGNARNGNNMGSVPYIGGKFNSSFGLNGINTTYIQVPHNNALNMNGTAGYSVSVWLKLNQDFNVGTSPTVGIVTKRMTDGSNDGWILDLCNTADCGSSFRGILLFNDDGTTTAGIGTNTLHNLTANRWTHIVGVFNGTWMWIYQDGVSKIDGTRTVKPANVNTANLTIGKDRENNAVALNGSVDEVMIFNRSLSLEEVQSLYVSGSTKYNDMTTRNVGVNWTKTTDGEKTCNVDGTYTTYTIPTTASLALFEPKLYSNANNSYSPTLSGYTLQSWTLSGGGGGDTTYPTFTNLGFNYTNNTQYNNLVYSANSTITNTNGTVGIEFNGINYTSTNLSSLFTSTLGSLSAGTYPYYWWAFGNGTSHNYNLTQTYYYTIAQASSVVYAYINNSRANLTIQKNDYVWLNGTRQTGSGNVNLYNNGTIINSGISIGNYTLYTNVGLYNISCIYPSTQNYSASAETWWLNVICTSNLQNTTKTDYINTTCSGSQMNQSRNWTQYDLNGCVSNSTYYEYQLTGPTYQNTTWSNWDSGVCSGINLNKSRNLTQFDIFACASNTTFFEYNMSYANLQNTTWSEWSNLTCSGSQMNQSRNLTEYDSNNLGCFANLTILDYQLVGPTWQNTSWGSWTNLTCIGQQRNQTRNLTEYDSYGCGSNTTFFQYQLINDPTCDTQSPTWTSLTNKTCYVNSTCTHSVSATDNYGIDGYFINNSNWFINRSTGAIKNNSAIVTLSLWWLNVSVNDTNGNKISGVIWINITTSPTPSNVTTISTALCRYKKYGYYNLNLPWFRQTNCI